MQRSNTKRPDLRHIRVAIPKSLQHDIDPKITPSTSFTATPQNPKPTLLNIAREIRDLILDNLLISPALGTGASMCAKLNGTEIPITKETPQFLFHTSILYTCKQLYEEGFKVLYGRNEFIVDCLEYPDARPRRNQNWRSTPVGWFDSLEVYAISDTLVISPLTRVLEDSYFTHGMCMALDCQTLELAFGQYRSKQISHIKNWKVLVRCPTGIYDMHALLRFCQAVCHVPGLKITFLLVGTGKSEDESVDLNTAVNIWNPLKLLRNVAKVEFREATHEEVPEYMSYTLSRGFYSCKGFLSSINLLREHVALMKGSSPLIDTEFIHLQYERLLAYTQTFECNPELRADLAFHVDLEAKSPRWRCPNNTFRGENLYHVEEHLNNARKAASSSNINTSLFKLSRNHVLLELEKQYKAINRHAFKIKEFIKSEKRSEGFFGLSWSDPRISLNKPYNGTGTIMKHRKTKRIVEAHQEFLNNEWWDPSTEALMLLEKYADSFARVPSRQWSVHFRRHNTASLNASLPRAKLIENIKEAYKCREYNDFVQGFKEAVDDMDGQLIEIRKERQRLFEYGNIEETERIIRLDYRKFEAADWSLN
ncbi:hypothetical protein ACHAP3_006785 [Botrytis cinerea]